MKISELVFTGLLVSPGEVWWSQRSGLDAVGKSEISVAADQTLIP
jgi:hypothetical protein